MDKQHDNTVSQTLEHALALIVCRIHGIIDTAPGLDNASPEGLAKLVRLASELEGRAEYVAAGIDDEPESSNDDEPKAGNGVDKEPRR